MDSLELAKRIVNCLFDGYEDEKWREETETGLGDELYEIGSGSVKAALIKLCERIEELETQ